MISLVTFTDPIRECSYRPDQWARTGYEIVAAISPEEYEARMNAGWRRFGHSLFRQQCPDCQACQSLRIPVATFVSNRSQRRAWAANHDVTLTITLPAVTDEKLALYDRFHADHEARIGWPRRPPKDAADYYESFVHQPFPVEEWQYRIHDKLIGLGYVDALPRSLSAIYFFHDPDERKRSLGTFNVLKVLDEARQRGKKHVHLGFFVPGCRSLEYKQRFGPHEVLGADGQWHLAAESAVSRCDQKRTEPSDS